MIKRLLFLFLILASCSQIKSQSKFNKEWNIGVGFGPTFSNMSIVPNNKYNSINTKSIAQFHGGVSVRYLTENHLGLIGELNYSQQGWESEFEEGSTYTHKRKLNYLEIPLLTHIYFGSQKTRFFVNLGPQIGYLLSESNIRNEALDTWMTNYDNNTSSDKTISYEIESYRASADKKLDYGIVAGAGMELRTKLGNFALEGRYYMGFGDIYNNRKKDTYSRSANRVLSVRLTYFVQVFNK